MTNSVRGTLRQVHGIRLLSGQAGMKAARESLQAESSRRYEAEHEKSAARRDKLTNELEAQNKCNFGMVIGALAVIPGALTVAGIASLTAASVGVSGLAAVVGVVSSVIGSTAMAGLTLSQLGNAFGEVAALGDRGDAEAAGREVALLEHEIGSSESKIEAEKASIAEDRRAVRKVRRAVREELSQQREDDASFQATLAGGGRRATLTRGAGAGAAVLAASNASALADESVARGEQRAALAEAQELRNQVLHQRQEASRKRESNAKARAWLGLTTRVVELAGTFVSGGGLQIAGAAIKVAGGAGGIANALIRDTAARELDLSAARLSLAAKEQNQRAADAGEKANAAAQQAERSAEAARATNQSVRGEGDSMGATIMGLGEVQKIRAKMALEEEKGARAEARSIREESFGLEEKALEAKMEGDAQASASELRNLIFASVGAGLSLTSFGLTSVPELDGALNGTKTAGGAVGGLSKATLEMAKEVAKAVDATSEAAKVANAGITYLANRSMRESYLDQEKIQLEAKRVENEAADMKDRADEAREQARRSLDAALAVQRDLRPVMG